MPAEVTPPNPAGLSDHEAALRLRRDGYNELQQGSRRTVLRIMLEVAREPMFQLLCAAGIVYLVLGNIGEALMLLGFVAITITITIVQEKRTENVLEALRDLTSPRALVIRGGRRKRIAGREVVCGDLPFIFSGSMVVRGHGLAEVTATGGTSEIGKIGKALGVIENEPTPLHA